MGEASRSAHLYDGGLADVLRHGGAVEDAVAVGGPLDVAQPAWPVRVAHQVGVERDGVVAGVTYEQKRFSTTNTDDVKRVCLPDLGYGGNSPLKYSLSRTWTKSTPADG